MTAAVIVAAGRGTRMGADRNKVFLSLRGEPILVHTVRAFSDCDRIDGPVVVVTGREEIGEVSAMLDRAGLSCRVVPGGQDRQESVYLGLSAIPAQADFVAIHDGARPLVSRRVIENALECARIHGSGVAAVQVVDTIKTVDEQGRVTSTPPRSTLRAVQTPQVFRADLIRAAHERHRGPERATDDAMLFEAEGLPVYLSEGERQNLKITTPEDLILAEQILQNREEESR